MKTLEWLPLKKIIGSILIVIPIVLMTGCYDYTEYEEMQLVFGFGIDKGEEDDELIVTVQSSGFKKTDVQSMGGGGSSSGGSPNSSINKASSKTIMGAIDKLQQIISKELFFGYIKVIVVGNEVAKEHMDDIMAFFYMSPRVRGSAYLLIAEDKAYDTLSTVNLSDSDLSAKSLENAINKSVRSGVAFPIKLSDYYNIELSNGWEPAIPQVSYYRTKSKEDEEQGGDTKEKETNTNPNIVQEEDGYHLIREMVVFKDNKKIGVIDERETLCFGFITGQKINSSYVIDMPSEDSFLGFRFLKNAGKLNTKIEEGQIKAEIKVSVNASLDEYKGKKKLDDIEVIQSFEDKLSQALKKDIEKTIATVQKELKADIFGIGRRLFQQHPYQWNDHYKDDWEELFPNVKTEVKVKVKILNTGSNVEPFGIKE